MSLTAACSVRSACAQCLEKWPAMGDVGEMIKQGSNEEMKATHSHTHTHPLLHKVMEFGILAFVEIWPDLARLILQAFSVITA